MGVNMKRSTKFFALAALGTVTAFGPVASAQEATTTEKPATQADTDRRAEHLDKMFDEVKLTDDQKAKVKPVLKDEFEQFKAVRQDTSLSDTDKKAKYKSIHEATDAKLKTIMTPEQFSDWKKLHKERGGRYGTHKPSEDTTAPEK